MVSDGARTVECGGEPWRLPVEGGRTFSLLSRVYEARIVGMWKGETMREVKP